MQMAINEFSSHAVVAEDSASYIISAKSSVLW